MKKLFSILTAAACITACAFSFTACGGESGGNDNQTHTAHTWSATYTEDGDRHYQTCDGCDEKQYSNHDYGTSGVCVCGKEQPEEVHSHTWSTTYTEDGDRHYQTCDGCDEKQYSNHDYGTSGVCVCGKEKPVVIVAVESVSLDKTELTLEIDQTATLTATVAPDNATDKTVTYSVEPAGIVTVDNDGNVTALSAGTAVITATANGKTATCAVTVNAPVTNAEITNALDANCKDGVLKAGFPSSFIYDENKVSNGTWYMTKDQDGNITKAEYAFNYNLSEVDGYYFVNSVVFTNPLSVKDLINGNIANASYSNEYRVSYDKTIQASRQDLTNAICDTVFVSNGTVIARYIIDRGIAASDSVLTGTVNMFTVIEVTDKGVQQANVNIKTSSSDAEYASKLSNANNYRVFDEVSYTLVGTKLENNDLPF